MSRARRLLVDGWNVVGAVPDGWWRDRAAAAERLVAALEERAEMTGLEITVVFDGPERALSAERIAVEFARGARGAADRRIADLVRADPDPESLEVVTSDRELSMAVEEAGARVLASGGFRRDLY